MDVLSYLYSFMTKMTRENIKKWNVIIDKTTIGQMACTYNMYSFRLFSE